jgi:transposase
MRASPFHSKKDGLAECSSTQLDLFDHSVFEHIVVARLLCTRHAPKARCMMRQTYRQEWPSYNQAQTNEKSRFLELLYSLCDGIEEPVQTFGRPRLSFAEMIFCCCFKIYSTVSSRRFICDLREAMQKGYISKVPHFNSVCNYLESEQMTAYLKELIIESSRPLNVVETSFAVDSSGFSTAKTVRWLHQKYSKPHIIDKADWLKIHLMCGVTTNIVTAVEVSDRHAGDSPYFTPLVETTHQNFSMFEVSADKAYSSAKNLHLVLMKSAKPYIPFRSNTNPTKDSPSVWKKAFHYYQYNQEQFMAHYHRRSNVETTFSMIKAKFGERLRSKSKTAQTNELLCKILCHNICCLIQSIYELGVEPTFWSE